MNGQYHAGAHIQRCLNRLLRLHMNLRPTGIVSAIFHQYDVERPEALSDFGEMFAITAVTIKEKGKNRATSLPTTPIMS